MESATDVLFLLKKKIELEGDNITNTTEVDETKKNKPKKKQNQIFEIKKSKQK